MSELSTKPYLIRALYEWCGDAGYTPYIAVAVDERTLVPREFVKNGEIVLNISPLATHKLSIGNDLLGFQARFGGVARDLSIPIDNIISIYARETGHGMAFEVSRHADADEAEETPSERPTLAAVPTPTELREHDDPGLPEPPVPPAPGGRPQLRRIK
ncbi:ClpXP protease specificity-enhancing factor [Derxia gummosa]|uniref:ClpXP protease specificity-enhancing factor n=1 Tax=Derxia gummosa DSM 723 TaxID=1121388 RepID=A0A8B6X619_9BURK|nr:ClpXP protease specificity-enhancing factor [Derxia gummosa]